MATRALSQKHLELLGVQTLPYDDTFRLLSDAEREDARRFVATRRVAPKLDIRIIRGFVKPPECEILLAWAQNAYARGSGTEPGRNWFTSWSDESIFPAAFVDHASIAKLAECVALDLDRLALITAAERQKRRYGILRLSADLGIPGGMFRNEKRTGKGWLVLLNAREYDGGVFYWPHYQAAFALGEGDVLAYPRECPPCVTRLQAARGARFTLESHPPPKPLRSHAASLCGASHPPPFAPPDSLAPPASPSQRLLLPRA